MTPGSNDTGALELVCLGEPMVEFNQAAENTFIRGFGGDTSNCAISAARHGARVGYITRLGDDQFGDSLIELWRSESIDVSAIRRDADAPTGIYFVTHDARGHHFTYYRKRSAASKLRLDGVSSAAIANARALQLSAISLAISDTAAEAATAAIDVAASHNTRIAFDTNLRLNLWSLEKARELTHRAMARCQIALPSLDDARLLTGLDDADRIVDFYLDLGAENVLLKMGAQGVVAATRGRREKIAALDVVSIDANGAGDTFAGAFLAEFLRVDDLFAAARYANVAAALSTTRDGAVGSIPTRTDIKKFLER